MILESLTFTKSLYAFDFDGTLAKIVRRPEDATMTRATEKLLMQLSELVPVAIVSGRSIEDLKKRIRFSPEYVIGNHGLEGLGHRNGTLKTAKEICDRWKLQLKKDQALAHLFKAGVELEDKTFSLAIHYRRSRQKKKARDSILKCVQGLDPVARIIAGKSVVNLIPLGAPHKGVAVMELMKKLDAKHVFYIGDDDTDEDVFGLPEARIMSVRVGHKKASHARYYLERQSEINELLKRLIRFHRPKGNGGNA